MADARTGIPGAVGEPAGVRPRPRSDTVQAPLAGHPLEAVRALPLEGQARAGHQVRDRARDQDLAGAGLREDPAGELDGDPPDVAVDAAQHITLAGVHAGPHGEAEPRRRPDDGAGAAHGPGGAVEGGQEAGAGGPDLLAAVAGELLAHARPVGLDGPAPARGAEPGRGGRLHHLHLHGGHGEEHPVGLRRRPGAGEELLDLVEERVLVADERQVVLARELDVAGAGDVRGQVPAALDRQRPVARPVQASAGTRMLGSTRRVSTAEFIRDRATAAPGLALMRR